jgi:hypothetical protein
MIVLFFRGNIRPSCLQSFFLPDRRPKKEDYAKDAERLPVRHG